jgi:hypothetical protein
MKKCKMQAIIIIIIIIIVNNIINMEIGQLLTVSVSRV